MTDLQIAWINVLLKKELDKADKEDSKTKEYYGKTNKVITKSFNLKQERPIDG